MPSPIAHITAGYAIYRLSSARRYVGKRWPRLGSLPGLLLLTALLSLLPDFDFVPGLLLGDFDQFHNTISNSLLVGIVVALLFASFLWLVQGRTHFAAWFSLTLLCYESHVLMDYFTIGRGVMLLWPFSTARYKPAVNLFYGLHRSSGWLTIHHLWTVFTELAFAILVIVAVNVIEHRRGNKSRSRSQDEGSGQTAL